MLMLVACSPSVPSCSDEVVQNKLVRIAKNHYNDQLVATKTKSEFELKQAKANADYAHNEKNKGTMKVVKSIGVAGFSELNTNIARYELLLEHPPYESTLDTLESLLQTLSDSKFSFERITTIDTSQSTGAHHCSANLLFFHKNNPLVRKIDYAVRKTDAGEIYVAAQLPTI